jgi:hypothetical protein
LRAASPESVPLCVSAPLLVSLPLDSSALDWVGLASADGASFCALSPDVSPYL